MSPKKMLLLYLRILSQQWEKEGNVCVCVCVSAALVAAARWRCNTCLPRPVGSMPEDGALPNPTPTPTLTTTSSRPLSVILTIVPTGLPAGGVLTSQDF